MSEVIDINSKRKKKEAEKELLAMQEMSKEVDNLITERIAYFLGTCPKVGQIDPRLVALLFCDRVGNLLGVLSNLGVSEDSCYATLRKCDETMLRAYYHRVKNPNG
jgi:hypothetical protein